MWDPTFARVGMQYITQAGLVQSAGNGEFTECKLSTFELCSDLVDQDCLILFYRKTNSLSLSVSDRYRELHDCAPSLIIHTDVTI